MMYALFPSTVIVGCKEQSFKKQFINNNCLTAATLLDILFVLAISNSCSAPTLQHEFHVLMHLRRNQINIWSLMDVNTSWSSCRTSFMVIDFMLPPVLRCISQSWLRQLRSRFVIAATKFAHLSNLIACATNKKELWFRGGIRYTTCRTSFLEATLMFSMGCWYIAAPRLGEKVCSAPLTAWEEAGGFIAKLNSCNLRVH